MVFETVDSNEVNTRGDRERENCNHYIISYVHNSQ